MKKLNVSWHKYWSLTIISEVIPCTKDRKVLCLCDCGKYKEISLYNIRLWKTTSCWCVQSTRASVLFRKHWLSWSRSYSTWEWMKQRCYNNKHQQYKDYWWRWIIIEWESFEDFHDDIWCKLTEWFSIERVDVDGNYSKSNCTLIPRSRQIYNTTRTIWVTYEWKQMCLSEACKLKWVSYWRIKNRIRNLWWSVDRALNS